jgi:hypothetical protein
MCKRKKTNTIDKICDIYLGRLLKLENEEKRTEFLVDILDKKGVYYDQETIDDVIKKLKGKDLIEKVFGVSASSYETKKKLEVKEVMPPDHIKSNLDSLSKLKISVDLYVLTNKGRSFVKKRQIIDLDGKRIRQENKKKWLDRIFGFISGILVTIATKWLLDLLG